MNRAQKVMFVVLIVCVFFIVLNIDIRGKRQQFNLCKPSAVSKVIVKHSGIDYAIVKNQASFWEIEYEGDQTRADDNAVKAFLTLACFLPYREEFDLTSETSSPKMADYGLETPRVTLTVFGQKPVTESFGDTAPTGTEYYYTNSAEENKDKLYTIPNLFYGGLAVTPFDFKNRVLLPDLNDNAEKIVVSFADIQLELHKQNEIWQISNYPGLTAEQAGDLVQHLYSFYFTKYHGPLIKEDFSHFGIDNPDVLLEISRVGSDRPERYSLTVVGSRYYMTVAFGKQTYLPILDARSPEKFLETLRNIASKLPSSS